MSMMKSAMVKPIPDSAAPPATRRSVRPGRQLAEPRPLHQARRTGDADQLAEHEAGDDAPRQRRAHRRRHRVSRSSRTPALANANSGSTRNDTYGPNCGLQPLVDRDRFAQTASRGARVLGVRRLPERPDQLDGLLDPLALRGEHRNQQRDRHTRQRRVHTAGVQRHPQRERQHRVRGAAARGQQPDQRDRDDQHQRATSRGTEPHAVGVEQRDHQQRTDVVDDGQRQQEGAQPGRVLRAR